MTIVNGVALLVWICQGCGVTHQEMDFLGDSQEINVIIPEGWATRYNQTGNEPRVYCSLCGEKQGWVMNTYRTWEEHGRS
jgi:hypothetical protein